MSLDQVSKFRGVICDERKQQGFFQKHNFTSEWKYNPASLSVLELCLHDLWKYVCIPVCSEGSPEPCRNPFSISSSVNPLTVLTKSKIPSMFTLRNYRLTLCAWGCAFGECHTIFSENTGICEKSVLYSVQPLHTAEVHGVSVKRKFLEDIWMSQWSSL